MTLLGSHKKAARAQQNCVALGVPELRAAGSAKEIMKKLKAYFAPDARDTVYQGAAKFSRYRKTTWDVDSCLVRFDLLRYRLGGGGTSQTPFLLFSLTDGQH